MELEKWQIERVEAGIKAVDNNQFATEKQVEKAFEICRS